ncbi:lipopolysaccharide assembly protein LapA domain-containing protein [Parvularcula sp. LCG005]|uniref:lipopolysaccharide assembly protein LapA domain-containing protein n=1 Tax=Parvularcula sp. LCG005 TaxID=3078805 RepID=UPI0029421787|nr:lipopolysaccharide assembly protein LapA domain-containing protein [Parvularcula sp. LCG005]WOI53249.1 lipopolysaccharide assembly protein LapA domain-containing protein [Parvularcula sp. LCG005]
MRKIIVYILLALVFVLLVVFFVANQQPVMISMDPLSTDSPAVAIGPYPMWAMAAGTLFIGFGLGAVGMWLSDGSLRRRARERQRRIRQLEDELKAVRRGDETGETRSGLPALKR